MSQAEISTISKLSSIRVKLLVAQLVRRVIDDGAIDLAKVQKLATGTILQGTACRLLPATSSTRVLNPSLLTFMASRSLWVYLGRRDIFFADATRTSFPLTPDSYEVDGVITTSPVYDIYIKKRVKCVG